MEVNGLEKWYAERGTRISQGSAYLNHMLTLVRGGGLSGLSNGELRQAGGEVAFYQGMPTFLDKLKNSIERNERYAKHDIKLEHYIVSTGLKAIIAGSAVGSKVQGIWACEFIDVPFVPGSGQQALPDGSQEVSQIGFVVDDTSKTRAVFEINKGVNVNEEIDINGLMAPEDRRVPFENMICVADGPSDVPMFSLVNHFGGKSFAVYNPDSERHFEQVALLREQGRVLAASPGDFREGHDAANWLRRASRQIANAIVLRREEMLDDIVAKPPAHVPPQSMEVRDSELAQSS